MMNLINQMLGDFRGDALKNVSTVLGESPGQTQTALGAAVPALVGGLANRATNAGEANALLDLIRGNHFDSGEYADTASALKPNALNRLIDTGRPLLDSVFGSRTGSVAEWVSSRAGVSRASASSLLGLALPLVLGQIGRQVKGAGWNASNLQSLLAGQRGFLQEAPAGLAGILNDNSTGAAQVVGNYDRDTRARAVGTYETAAPVPARRASWLWVLPLLLLIPLLGWLLSRPTEEPVRQVAVSPAVVDTPRAVTTPAPALGAFVDKRLPNDIALRIPSNGVESRLLAYIEDPARPVSTETWFSFDRIAFESDSARLTPQSKEQLQNIANILNAYPQVKVKIGGYTDNQADAAYNLKLSQERATNTMSEIASLGIAPARMEAEGYGETHPVADNSTAEGRQRNRRIDIRVTDK